MDVSEAISLCWRTMPLRGLGLRGGQGHYVCIVRQVLGSSHNGAKHSPPGRRGPPDCPSAQMRTSDFHIVFGDFGTDFEALMISHGMKSNNRPRQ